MKKLVVPAVIALMIAPSFAMAGYSFRGEANGWGLSPMTDNLDGTYSITIVGQPANTQQKYKVDTDPPGDWSSAYPKEDWWTITDGTGSYTVVFDTNVIGDGWSPASNRVKSPDPGIAWEVIGDFTDWQGGAPEPQMVYQGGGLYSVDVTIANAGAHAYKFRASGDTGWGQQIGDFTGSGNIEFNAPNAGEIWRFELDIPNGRWRQFVVPEPATMTLLALAAFAVARRRR